MPHSPSLSRRSRDPRRSRRSTLPGLALLLAVPILGTALATPAAAQDAQVPDAIAAYVDAFQSAVRSYDVDRWASLVTDDVVMMAPNGRTVEGRDAFHAMWSRTFEGRTGDNPLHIVVRGVEHSGDLAVVRADYGPEGADAVGQYVWTLVKDPEAGWLTRWWIFNRRS